VNIEFKPDEDAGEDPANYQVGPRGRHADRPPPPYFYTSPYPPAGYYPGFAAPWDSQATRRTPAPPGGRGRGTVVPGTPRQAPASSRQLTSARVRHRGVDLRVRHGAISTRLDGTKKVTDRSIFTFDVQPRGMGEPEGPGTLAQWPRIA
jgi:hypothetical protein